MNITFKTVAIVVVLICVIVSFQSGLNVILKLSDKYILPDHGGQKHLLLLATTRTGSSFVGELFNQQRDNMAYLYEPLYHVDTMLSVKKEINDTAIARAYPDVLRQLFQCNFSLLESFIKPHPVDHITRSLFRRDCSRFLCEEAVCSPPIKGLFELHHCKIRACGPLNLTKASESCLQKKHRVIKVVRVHHFHILQPLAEDKNLNVKFIQLVRDPRARLSSRMEAFGNRFKNLKSWVKGEDQLLLDDLMNDLQKLKTSCDTVRVAAELGLSQPPWLYGRYMLVRYEDIARFPVQKAEEMYQFYGIPFTTQIKSWILKSTSKETGGVYTLQKNASTHIEKWRSRLPFKLVEVIQNICEPTMKLFGYKFATSEQMLRDTSIKLYENKDFKVL